MLVSFFIKIEHKFLSVTPIIYKNNIKPYGARLSYAQFLPKGRREGLFLQVEDERRPLLVGVLWFSTYCLMMDKGAPPQEPAK